MANPTIDGEEFIRIGELEAVQDRTELITRPNVDGTAIRKVGKKGRQQTLVAVKDVVAADGAALKVLIDDWIALAATTVQIVTNNGVVRDNMHIVNVRIPMGTGNRPNPQKTPLSVGGIQAPGTATHLVRVEFTVIDTSLTP